MPQSFATASGVLKIPGAYPEYNVVQPASGLSTTGIVVVVGEADGGPDYTLEEDLASNIYGPNQIGDIIAKYRSGRLVDAFNGLAVPANDPQITGSPQAIIVVKTNPSTKASDELSHWDASDYAAIQDRNYGKPGNLISYEIEARSDEVVPTTEAFAFMLPTVSTNINVRVNGGAATAITVAALATPATFAGQLTAVAGVDTTGGQDRVVLSSVTGTLALTVIAGNRVQIDRSVAFNGTAPVIGDTMYIPASSALASIETENAGSYLVTGFSASQILATKLLDVTGAHNALTPPTSQAAISVAATTDLQVFAAIEAFLVAADPTDGYGKNLQINELETASGRLTSNCYVMGTTAPEAVDWISTEDDPTLIVSATEYVAQLTESRSSDGVMNEIYAGGTVALKIGYVGTTGSAQVTSTQMVITTTGGLSAGTMTISLEDFSTLADLAAYIGSFAGFSAAPGTATLGSQPSTSLDQGTYGICSTWGDYPGRIKQDAYKFFAAVRDNGLLVELDEQADAGLPGPTTGVAFLTGGAKGATTDAIYQLAMDALKLLRANFVVPLFSRDAADDVADNLTDASSTYTIAAVHAATRQHVLQMSTLKKRRNRQAFLSLDSDIDTVKNTAANLASFRCALAFQDVRDIKSTGGVGQFQSWMNAVKAAGMQAAGFYRNIFNKGINISGALQAAGDFNDQDDDAVEQCLDAGLLIIRRPESGGFRYVSDQTTYTKDSNFVYNSIQAIYASDTISLTTAQLMEQAFVGQSLADISASLALTTLEGIMENLRRLKLITFSDDAPKGYKNAQIRITGPAMVVSCEVKVATGLYFIPITFSITQVQQSA